MFQLTTDAIIFIRIWIHRERLEPVFFFFACLPVRDYT
jgi:hypothetical protein